VIDLLREMQRAGVYLAVAVDEHGGTAGIVTIEDVVAELVGNVSDEPQTPAIRQTGPDRWEVDGSTDVAEVERALGVDLPNGDWHTVGGMVMGVTGRIPEQGESIDLEAAHIRVLAASERKVELVEVTTPGAGD